jgi:alpha-N-arabinofuranosidase
MFTMTHQYDKTDRNGPKIFVGEWATREGSPTPDMNAALGDAAWMTGLERNSDIVIMASYAPLFVNVNPGGMQWATDLIGYDALRSYGSPSYYAQVLFSNHIGNQILNGELETSEARVFYSATKDSGSGMIYLKIVNGSTDPVDVTIKVNGNIGPKARIWTLRAQSRAETNLIDSPERIVPVEGTIEGAGPSFQQTFAPLSISVLELPAQ